MRIRKWVALSAATAMLAACAGDNGDGDAAAPDDNGDAAGEAGEDWPDELVLTLQPAEDADELLDDAGVLADHDVPTREIHLTEGKHRVRCDVYLDDAPHQVADIVRARAGEATVCRFVRPWNHPVPDAHDVRTWDGFADLVRSLPGRTDPTRDGVS